MHRPPPSGLLLAATVALLASSAQALTVDAARVQVGGRRGDVFRVQGRFEPIAIAEGADVPFRFGDATITVPAAQLRRRKRILVHRGGKSPASLALLRLDLGRGRFVAVGVGWGLASLTGPVQIAIGDDCGMAGLADKGRRKANGRRTLVQTAAARASGGCALGVPRLMPITARVGVPTTVDVELDAGSATALALRRAGVDAPLCTLAPRGDVPGRMGCTITVNEATPTSLALFAEGQSGGARAVSPGVRLPVVPAVTAEDRALVATAMTEATRLWTDAKARLGDGFAARVDALRAMASVPGIASAALAPDGLNLVVRFTTGWQGFVLANRPADVDAMAVPAATATVARTPPPPAPRAIFRSCGDDTPDGEVCCTVDRRRVLEGRKVLVWSPGFFAPRYDDVPELLQAFADHACLGLEVTALRGKAASVASLATFTSYATVITSTHGAIDEQGRVGICTADVYDPLHPPAQEDLDRGFINVAGGGADGVDGVLCASEDYIAALGGTFAEPAIVFASHCHSGAGRMSQAYLAKGAGTYLGFSGVVSGAYTKTMVVPQLFGGLLQHLRTAGVAWDRVEPKVDPYLGAAFGFQGSRDVAYAGKPTLTSDVGAIRGGEQATFAVTVEGGGTCAFTNHWHNSADFGDLGGGNDVESKEVSYVYTAKEVTPGAGSDGVGVEVLPPDSDEPIGIGCGGVAITGSCGDGIRQPDFEECDGLDDLACPGPCMPSCACAPAPTTTTVSTTTSTSSTTTTTLVECTSSDDCGLLGCCAPEGFCCYVGEGCPAPSAGPVFGDGFGNCSYTSSPDPPSPVDFAAVCGPSAPTTCPAPAVLPVSYNCTRCADGRAHSWLHDNDTGENTPYP